MKKLLAVLLALTMILSMVCFAGAEDFTDIGDVDVMNREAVNVLSEMGIIAGMGDGTFAPEKILTRAQAAKIICYMLLGETAAEALPTADGKFGDVPASHWSNKYVNYCAEQGIAAGTGANKFNPNGELTGFAFGKMLLCGALGYNAEAEGLTGSSWDRNTNTLLKKNRLHQGTEINAKGMSRQNACHLALNALFFCAEEGDAESTLAYKNFKATRCFGSLDQNNFRRPDRIYTTEEENTLWDGTDLVIPASPVFIAHAQTPAKDICDAIGVTEISVDQLAGYRNNVPATKDSLGSVPLNNTNATAMNSTGNGVSWELYYDESTDAYIMVAVGTRTSRIASVKEPVMAADGGIMEHGSVTLENGLAHESDEFTEADVGSYALFEGNCQSSWKNPPKSIHRVWKPTIVTGKLGSDASYVIGGKTYKTPHSTIANNDSMQDVKQYIEAGGQVGDTVNAVIDEFGTCYMIYQ